MTEMTEMTKQIERLERAKAALTGEITFAAILSDGSLLTSAKKGIAPMMALLAENQESLRGAVVADRVIGRAAALLMEFAGVAAAYGGIVSSHALRAFAKSGLRLEYETEVAYIINRSGTGMCPMEETVLEIEDADAAYPALQKRLAALR